MRTVTKRVRATDDEDARHQRRKGGGGIDHSDKTGRTGCMTDCPCLSNYRREDLRMRSSTWASRRNSNEVVFWAAQILRLHNCWGTLIVYAGPSEQDVAGTATVFYAKKQM